VNGLHVTSTSDVSLDTLSQQTQALSLHVPVEVDPRQAGFKSFDPPSWVHFFQDPHFWIETFVGGLAFEFAKAAAKVTWRQGGRVKLATIAGADAALREFVECVSILREHLGASTALRLGLPVPNDWFGTLLSLEGNDPDLLAAQVSLFLVHLPALEQLLEMHAAHSATGFFLSLSDTGEMIVEWYDKTTLTPYKETLRLPDVA